MVFSFFKKQPEKMPERQAARPRAPAVTQPEVPVEQPVEEVVPVAEPLPDLEFTSNDRPAVVVSSQPPADKVSAAADDLAFDMDEFDREFAESSVMEIDVAHDLDPLQGDIEQAVVLFANGQDAAARSLLETFIYSYPGQEGRRFWLLLFDLLQVLGDQTGFEKLGVEFAEACETSPPTWREQAPVVRSSENGLKLFTLQGVLTAEGQQPLDELRNVLAAKQPALIDCGKLIGCDDVVAGQFAELLSQARRRGVVLTLERAEAFLGRLNDRLQVGDPAHATSWQLLLELLQRLGPQEAFEERAVDYAVTFELSPPSWEVQPAGKSPLPAAARADDAYFLAGDLKSSRFEELVAVLERHDSPILDFSAVRRMDFFSAGQLVNRLAPYKAAGRDIIIRSPNHLVAELMAVVGLNKQARIIVPKS